MKFTAPLLAVAVLVGSALVRPSAAADAGEQWVVYPGGEGPGKGKHIVLVSGDEEYRSEEGLPQLGKILSQRHGFKCTVLFAVDEKGEINPKHITNIPGLGALDSADLMIILTRWRKLPAEQMKHIDAFLMAGKPVIGLRTATHAFNAIEGEYAKYNDGYDGPEKEWADGFGRLVLGEKWVAHHGTHKAESTRGLLAPDAKDHPILRGIGDGEIWGSSDVYTVRLPLPGDSKPLVMGQVLKRRGEAGKDRNFGMRPDDEPLKPGESGPAKPNKRGITPPADKNNPMMPIAWTKSYQLPGGKQGKSFTTTMGSAADLENEALRRLVVNAVYHLLGMEVPAKADVAIVGTYEPTGYGFGAFKQGAKPADHRLK